MTPEGYKEIEEEIARLKKDRPRRIKILQEARSTKSVKNKCLSVFTDAFTYLTSKIVT